jgi:hypothetical protein
MSKIDSGFVFFTDFFDISEIIIQYTRENKNKIKKFMS